MTSDQERWAEALAVLELHGDKARDFVIDRFTDLAVAGDGPGVARWRQIEARLVQLNGSSTTPH
jgi:hypothetical protein